ncbi:MAG: 4Fe-4S dicluster domain-containing protein [bacterium]|nr:4Fe-4S dicluster domain-containing protein [bacterium]
MITLDQAACTGCGTCVKVCPHFVLELRELKAVLASEERCIECAACQLNCLEGAIEVTKGTGCLVAIIREDILKLDGAAASCGCG